jgi:hypothetical protein
MEANAVRHGGRSAGAVRCAIRADDALKPLHRKRTHEAKAVEEAL